MVLRKLCSVMSRAAAAQRSTILPSRQRQTRRVRNRTPPWGGRKHVLGLAEGASENQVVVRGLMEDLVRCGVKADRKYLSVIDGSKALRAAIDAVFGSRNPVQRCRHHKIENVMGYLPEHLKDQVKAAMRAAFRLTATEGIARLERQAQWLEREYPDAAASLREGSEEMFTAEGGTPPWLVRFFDLWHPWVNRP